MFLVPYKRKYVSSNYIVISDIGTVGVATSSGGYTGRYYFQFDVGVPLCHGSGYYAFHGDRMISRSSVSPYFDEPNVSKYKTYTEAFYDIFFVKGNKLTPKNPIPITELFYGPSSSSSSPSSSSLGSSSSSPSSSSSSSSSLKSDSSFSNARYLTLVSTSASVASGVESLIAKCKTLEKENVALTKEVNSYKAIIQTLEAQRDPTPKVPI